LGIGGVTGENLDKVKHWCDIIKRLRIAISMPIAGCSNGIESLQ
jgi:hypothetical protein